MRCLFIGGDFDGDVIEVDDPKYNHQYQVPKRRPAFTLASYAALPVSPNDMYYCLYERHEFPDGETIRYVYAVPGTNIMESLIRGYRGRKW